jgi:hypothetical protein
MTQERRRWAQEHDKQERTTIAAQSDLMIAAHTIDVQGPGRTAA